LSIEEQKNCSYTSTNDGCSFVVFIDCLINHLLTLTFGDVVIRFDFIESMWHLTNIKVQFSDLTFSPLFLKGEIRLW